MNLSNDWPTPSEALHVKSSKSRYKVKFQKHEFSHNNKSLNKNVKNGAITGQYFNIPYIKEFYMNDDVYKYCYTDPQCFTKPMKPCCTKDSNINSAIFTFNNWLSNSVFYNDFNAIPFNFLFYNNQDEENIPPQTDNQKILLVKANVLSYYFSESNLYNDKYLISIMDCNGWVDLDELLKFPRLKKINTTKEDVVEVIGLFKYPKLLDGSETSLNVDAFLELSEDKTKIRRNDMNDFRDRCAFMLSESEVPRIYEPPFPKYTYKTFISSNGDGTQMTLSKGSGKEVKMKRGSRKSENIKDLDTNDHSQDNLEFEFSSKPSMKAAYSSKHKYSRRSKERSRSRNASGESEDELDESNIFILSFQPKKSEVKLNWADINDSDCDDNEAQIINSSLKTPSISQRLLNKHPSGDRHPNPDYLPRSKIQEQIREIIFDGLQDWKSNTEFYHRSRKDSSSSTSSDIKLTICQDENKFKLMKKSLNKDNTEDKNEPSLPNNEIHIDQKVDIMTQNTVKVLKFKPLDDDFENSEILSEASSTSFNHPIYYDSWNVPINYEHFDTYLEKLMSNIKFETDFHQDSQAYNTQVTDKMENKSLTQSKSSGVKSESMKRTCKIGFYPVTKFGPSKNKTKDKTRASKNPVEECDVGYAYGGRYGRRLRTQSGSSYIQYNDAGYAVTHGIPIPFKDHPSQLLLNDNGFKIKLYNVFCRDSLNDRDKRGIGRSQEMNTLFRFWSFFLRENKNKNMYEEFQKLAWEDASKGYRYGLECLFRMYTYKLEQKKYFSEEMFRDFQKNVIKDIESNHLYGLEKFWAFLKYSGYQNDTAIDPKLQEYLRKYQTLDDFRVNFVPPQGFHSYKIDNPESKCEATS